MIDNFKNKTKQRKNDLKILAWLIVVFLLVVWFCTPPGNKFLQVCFWGHNTQYFFSKIFTPDKVSEYRFYRSNAVYLAKMKMKKEALREIDKAVYSIPAYVPESELQNLYRDRAYIRLFFGEYQGALSDFMNSGSIGFDDNLKVAMLFKESGKYKEALSYCSAILNLDVNAYIGYACVSDIYKTLNRPDTAIKVWQLAVSRKENNARAYMEMAKLYKSMGNMSRYDEYKAKALHYNAVIKEDESYIYDVMHPKILTLSVK